MRRVRCVVCGEMLTVDRRTTRMHKRCITAYVKRERGADFYRENAMRAQAEATATKRRTALDRWMQRYPDCPPETARLIYMGGYRAGHRQGRREWAGGR